MQYNEKPRRGPDGRTLTGFSKLNIQIIYSAKLDMRPYCTYVCAAEAGAEYELKGIMRHHGDRADMGQYDCLQRLPNGPWLQRNDANEPRVVPLHCAMGYLMDVSTLMYVRKPYR